ncbi:MAG: TolC family outer membrane protein [Hyphomicrobiaceae bacterium]
MAAYDKACMGPWSAAPPGAFRCARAIALALAIAAGVMPAHQARAESLKEAMRAAYRNNPQLDAERARLRATDEDVARAASGYRPTLRGSVEVGYQSTSVRPAVPSAGEAQPWGYQLSLSQPIFSGFRTESAVSEAEAAVRAGRQDLRLVESRTLLDTVAAYADVVAAGRILSLRESNVGVLSRELEAAEARRAVREVTLTDVAQARARRARAVSAADLAKSDLRIARASYLKVVGHAPAALDSPPFPERLLPESLGQAIEISLRDSPNVVSALYREEAARFAVDRVRGELLPQVSIEASYGERNDVSRLISQETEASITGRVSIPLYQGGEVHARVRQAKHQHVGRIQEIEQARSESEANVTAAWSRLQAARAQMRSDEVQVDAAQTALRGVREEEKVGQRTLLDVLNAEQERLDAEVSLVRTRRDLVVASFSLLAAMGQLTADRLSLDDRLYDAEVHYQETRRKWVGTSIADDERRLREPLRYRPRAAAQAWDDPAPVAARRSQADDFDPPEPPPTRAGMRVDDVDRDSLPPPEALVVPRTQSPPTSRPMPRLRERLRWPGD